MATEMSELETIVFRGQTWTVADARWDESGLEGGAGSHWHLTLVEAPDERTPERPRARRERTVTSGIEWKDPSEVPGAVLSAEAQQRLQEQLRDIDQAQARARVSARDYVVFR